MKYANKIYAIVCDDVRDEKGNKLSLMGIYQRNIIVEKFPSVLKQLTIAVFLDDLIEPFSEIHFTGKFPKAEDVKISVKAPPGIKKGQSASMVFGIAPFKLNRAGNATFEIRFDDLKRPSYIRKLTIEKGKVR